VACDAPPADASPFCAICAGAVDPVPPGCPRCGSPGPATTCPACAASPPAFAAVSAAGLLGGPLADAIHALKYGDRPESAGPLGRWLAGRVAVPAGAVVAWVPLARRRRIARGYDQAMLLGAAFAREAGRPLVRGALRRIRETPPQVGRDRSARSRNVAGAFAATATFSGREVVLLDDVVTTGATADAAARALVMAGARRVVAVALARAE
jgi:ComF family protein